jgi:hypothetical protein
MGLYLFLLSEEVGGINYDWQLAGPPGGSEYNFSVVQALFTVYLLHELKIPEKRGLDFLVDLTLFWPCRR